MDTAQTKLRASWKWKCVRWFRIKLMDLTNSLGMILVKWSNEASKIDAEDDRI